jgi:hypothetical protein
MAASSQLCPVALGKGLRNVLSRRGCSARAPTFATERCACAGHRRHHPPDPASGAAADGWDLGFGSRDHTPVARLLIGLRCPLLLLAIVGLIGSRREEGDLWLIMPSVAVTFVHTLLFAKPRYIVPAESFLIILAVEGALIALDHVHSPARGSALRCAGRGHVAEGAMPNTPDTIVVIPCYNERQRRDTTQFAKAAASHE